MSSPDGLLIVDKPIGPTSHDVVARVRRALGETRVGHTGTLDPAASGVLALVVGRATRLARFMAGDVKQYEARVRLGRDTDTCDATGAPVGAPFTGTWPPRAAIEAALASFNGTFLQRPPAYSAKKIAGRRSYALARAGARAGLAAPVVGPEPAPVTLWKVEATGYEEGVLDLRLDCSAGFYVRSLARDLGERLGTGAHLEALRRTRSGSATLAQAHRLEDIERDRAGALDALIPMSQLLPALPAVVLTEAAVERARHGRTLGPDDWATVNAVNPPNSVEPDAAVRLFSPAGTLVAIARATAQPGVLHPSVVLM